LLNPPKLVNYPTRAPNLIRTVAAVEKTATGLTSDGLAPVVSVIGEVLANPLMVRWWSVVVGVILVTRGGG
jgi:hypothetical protein